MSKMELTLRPLPDLGFQVVGDKVSFDERLNWLHELDARQNSAKLIYEFGFCERRIRKGQKLYQAGGE